MNKRKVLSGAIIMILDAVCIAVSFISALLIRDEFNINQLLLDEVYLNTYVKTIPIWVAISIAVFIALRLYSSIWSFVSLNEVNRMTEAYVILLVIGLLFIKTFNLNMPRSYYVVGFIFSYISTTGIRFGYRFYKLARHHIFNRFHVSELKRIMIVGAGSAGRILLNEFNTTEQCDARVVCFIDDNYSKRNQFIDGVRIVGDRYSIPEYARKLRVDKIIFAIPSCSSTEKKKILEICSKTKCELQSVPGIYQLVNGEVSISSLKKVDVNDLLGRDPISVNLNEIRQFISGKTVMVTGGGGSIGSELCRQIAKSHPRQLIIFDIYENNAYDIQMELQHDYPNLELKVLIGSVRNTARVNSVVEHFRPDIIFHAAAHKHVPLMEESPNEAIKNNVFGTYKMAQAADRFGVSKFVLISTDKAVNPTNIMGASKRICEMVVQMMSRRSDTDFVAVRFGNVLGSNGSVIPLFKKQIEEGGPVTVTHPDITRFFMTIPEAVSLVLQASYYAKGGEIFVLDMGQPVRIADMARNLIRLSGYEPDVDIKIVYTGLRPGEKLYEELLMDEEGLEATANKLIHIGKPIKMDDKQFENQLNQLRQAYEEETDSIRDIVAEIVPTYHNRTNKQTVNI